MEIGKLAIIGIAGYLLYEYFYAPAATGPVSSTTIPPVSAGSTQPGTVSDPGVDPIVTPTSTSSTSLVSSTVQTQLGQLAAEYLKNNPGATGLNLYQWEYLYQQITGTSLFSNQLGEKVTLSLGLNDNSAATTMIPITTFLTALSSNGLSGVRGVGMGNCIWL